MCQNVMHYSSMHSREVSVKPVFAKLPKDNHNGYIVLLNKSALIKPPKGALSCLSWTWLWTSFSYRKTFCYTKIIFYIAFCFMGHPFCVTYRAVNWT